MLLCIKFMLASTGEQTLLKIMGKTFSGLVHFSPMFHFSIPLIMSENQKIYRRVQVVTKWTKKWTKMDNGLMG